MSSIVSLQDLPRKELPDYWDNNERINSLYAPFRNQQVNSCERDSKLNCWKNLINIWTRYNKICIFTEHDLKKWFTKENRVPGCLSVILQEMQKTGELQTIENFLRKPQTSWTGWAIDLTIKNPLNWSYNKLSSILKSNNDVTYVHVPTVKNLTENILKQITETNRNKLLTMDEFLLISNLKNVNTQTLDLMLHHLQMQNKIDTVTNPNMYMVMVELEEKNKSVLIKVAPNNKDKVEAISEIDLALFNLEHNEKILLQKLELLEQKQVEYEENVRTYLKKGMRQMAKTYLRKKHEIEKRIEKLVKLSENLQALIASVSSAETDTKIFHSYKNGINAIKSILKENGLTEDTISDTMLELTETLEIHDNIQTTLSEPIAQLDDTGFEEELSNLLNEATKLNEQKPDDLEDLDKKLFNLPSIPENIDKPVNVKSLRLS